VSASLLGTGTWSQAFVERGFEARGTTWSKGDVRASIQGGWLVIRAPAPERELDLLASDAAWQGLWRLVPAAGGGLVRVFELPPTLVRRIESSPDEHATALATLAWALGSPGSAGLQPDSGSSSSPRLLPPNGRTAPLGAEQGWSPALPGETVRSGPLVAQIRVRQHGESSILELPLSTRPTSTVLPGRASWLRSVLADTRSRWRLVRCLLVDGVPAARVDLRGAPPAIDADLVAAALDALRQIGAWLLEPLDLVLDPGVVSPALDAGVPAPDRSPRRARPASSRRARPAPSNENQHGPLDDSPH